MAKEEKEKTSFKTEQGTFSYEEMSFRLKNVGSTHPQLMDKKLASQLGRNIDVYVDDMVIKSKNKGNLILHIADVLVTLRKSNMKPNLKKCTFEVETRKFLGDMITNKVVNPEKVKSIINIVSPKIMRKLQALNDKLTALERVSTNSAERSLTFFKRLKVCLKKDF